MGGWQRREAITSLHFWFGEQIAAELFFEALDRVAYRRLRHPATFGRACEVLLFTKRDEITNLICLHGGRLSSCDSDFSRAGRADCVICHKKVHFDQIVVIFIASFERLKITIGRR